MGRLLADAGHVGWNNGSAGPVGNVYMHGHYLAALTFIRFASLDQGLYHIGLYVHCFDRLDRNQLLLYLKAR